MLTAMRVGPQIALTMMMHDMLLAFTKPGARIGEHTLGPALNAIGTMLPSASRANYTLLADELCHDMVILLDTADYDSVPTFQLGRLDTGDPALVTAQTRGDAMTHSAPCLAGLVLAFGTATFFDHEPETEGSYEFALHIAR